MSSAINTAEIGSYYLDHWVPTDYQPPVYPSTSISWGSSSPRCSYCDGLGHASKPEICPRVKSIKYFESGKVAEIKFHKPEDD